MKPISRPQHYRVRRILQLVREGISSGRLANSSDFMADLGISRRTVARDLDFLRDEERLIRKSTLGELRGFGMSAQSDQGSLSQRDATDEQHSLPLRCPLSMKRFGFCLDDPTDAGSFFRI